MFHRRRSRRALLGALFAVLLFNATVSPVAATTKSYWTGNYGVTTYSPAWTGQASYRAQWDVYSTQDAGQTFRVVRNPVLYVYIFGGQHCLNRGVCKGFTLHVNAKWEVLNSSNVVLASRTNMAYGTCGWAFAYPYTVDLLLARCASGTWQLPASASKIRLTWKAGVTVNAQPTGTFWWPQVTRTVSLTAP